MKTKWIVDDSHEISEEIMKMPPQELRREIERLEEEARVKREACARQSAVN